MSGRGIPPVGSVSAMACGQDGCTILESNADDLAFAVGGHFQHISDAGGKEVAWRHLAFVTVGAHGFHRGIITSIAPFVVDVEVVGYYSC